MTGVGGGGAEPLCNLLSVLCQLVTETPDSFTGEASGVGYFLWREVARSYCILSSVFLRLASCLPLLSG